MGANQHLRQLYRCDVCDVEFPKHDMVVKRVVFVKAGFNAASLKSRTIAWLCLGCVELDVHWRLPARTAAPSARNSVRLESA